MTEFAEWIDNDPRGQTATREEQAVMDGGTPCPDCWTVHKGECL